MLIYNQLHKFAENTLNSILFGFPKAHTTQHALFQNELDNHGFVGTIVMDLSKTYGCISHKLFIAKLNLYRDTKNTLKLIFNYLSRPKQRTKIGSSGSACYDIITGVPSRTNSSYFTY